MSDHELKLGDPVIFSPPFGGKFRGTFGGGRAEFATIHMDLAQTSVFGEATGLSFLASTTTFFVNVADIAPVFPPTLEEKIRALFALAAATNNDDDDELIVMLPNGIVIFKNHGIAFGSRDPIEQINMAYAALIEGKQ